MRRSTPIQRAGRFLITIDTEGDNLWSSPREITTRNSSFLPRFQQLCERYGFRPTYLTNYEMACCPVFTGFGRDVQKRGVGEIGMHLHAWNSPPESPLTPDDFVYHPFLIEYPEAVMRAKIRLMTDLLERTFETKITSHRAGRWSFDERYARALVDEGYLVDCSVTPHVSWKEVRGDPNGRGGTDYRDFPESPYFIDLNDISKAGQSPLLEVPVSIATRQKGLLRLARQETGKGTLASRAIDRFFPPDMWLRPRPRNLKQMKYVLEVAKRKRASCVEFMLHSSEFMPGGSPVFPTSEDIESLYVSLEELFSTAASAWKGATLTEFYREFSPAAGTVGPTLSAGQA